MSTRYFILLLFWLSFVGCNKPVRKSNEITNIELARSGAWSDFGATISVDSSLDYIYFGDNGQIKQGYFAGKISAQFWDILNQKIGATRFKYADTTTNLAIKDAEYYELIVHWKGGKRRILRVGNISKDTILTFCRWMDTTYKLIKSVGFLLILAVNLKRDLTLFIGQT